MCSRRAVYLEGGRSQKAKQLFVCFTCRNFGRTGYQVEKKNNCGPLAAERPAAAMHIFVLFVPGTRIFRKKIVYMVLGSKLGRSYL